MKDEFACRAGGEISVKGLAYPLQTYEVIGPADGAAPQHDNAARDSLLAYLTALTALTPDERAAARAFLSEALPPPADPDPSA